MKLTDDPNSRGSLITICLIWFLSLTIASAPLSNLFGQYGYDACLGKCHILNCNLPSNLNIDLPAGGVTLTLGVGLPCFLTFVASLVIYKKLGLCFIYRPGTELENNSNEIHKMTSVLIFCYVVFILPIYIVEWIPYSEDKSPKITLLIYSWYWLIYIINVFVYIIYGQRCRDAIGLFFRDLLNITKISAATQEETTNTIPMGSISKCKENTLYSHSQGALSIMCDELEKLMDAIKAAKIHFEETGNPEKINELVYGFYGPLSVSGEENYLKSNNPLRQHGANQYIVKEVNGSPTVFFDWCGLNYCLGDIRRVNVPVFPSGHSIGLHVAYLTRNPLKLQYLTYKSEKVFITTSNESGEMIIKKWFPKHQSYLTFSNGDV